MSKKDHQIAKKIAWSAASILSASIAAAAGWILYSRKYIIHDLDLDNALDADREDYVSEQAGRMSYYVDRSGDGAPLVLLHSVNAAPSAFEMKPLFDHYLGKRPVYALDLPGFGFSERSERIYSPILYQRAITNFLRDVVGEPADVVGLSLSCEFAALSAVHDPQFTRSLVMISPTGFQPPKVNTLPESAQQRKAKNALYSVLAVGLWNRALYDLITSRPSIQYFLNMSFEGLVPEQVVDCAYQTSHQPGAAFAPTYFLGGKLFTPAVRETVYKVLEQPVLVIYDRDPYTNFEMLPVMVQGANNWQAKRVSPTKGLPHWEQPEKTTRAMADFWEMMA